MDRPIGKKVRRFLVVSFLAIIAVWSYVTWSEYEVHNFDSLTAFTYAQKFVNGELIWLSHCGSAWGWERGDLRFLYKGEEWSQLAKHVIKVGCAEDLSYFYLGRSAEGLGLPNAAKVYYKRALMAPKCDRFPFNNCDGHTFPQEIENRLGGL